MTLDKVIKAAFGRSGTLSARGLVGLFRRRDVDFQPNTNHV